MLIIYDDTGKITFGCSDDAYVNSYIKKHKKMPYTQYGKHSLFIQGVEYPKDLRMIKVDVNKKTIIEKSEEERKAVRNSIKHRIKRTLVMIKNVEVETMQTD